MRAAILLAAGSSRRFGRGDKLMARLRGRPLVLHALDRARAAGTRRVIVVVPSLGGRVGRLLAGRGLTRVVARRHCDGLGASLAAGLRALRPIEREVLVFLGDMPFAALPRRTRLPVGADAVRPVHRGQPGHPLLMRAAAARGAGLSGDQGLAGKIHIRPVPGAAGNLVDLDTVKALRLFGGRRCFSARR